MTKAERQLRRKLKHKERMRPATFWSECAVRAISYLCAVIIMTMVLSVALQVSTAQLTKITEYTAIAMAVLWCIPIARNTRSRLRDAGYTAKAYLWLLLPIVGWLVFIVLLCAKSTQTTACDSDHYIDTWEC